MRLAIAIIVFIFIVYTITDIISVQHQKRIAQEREWRKEFEKIYVGFHPEEAWKSFKKEKRKSR